MPTTNPTLTTSVAYQDSTLGSGSTALIDASNAVLDTLRLLASGSNFRTIIRDAFGDQFSSDVLFGLSQQWQLGNFEALPQVEIVTGATLNGGRGAYAISTNKIYLSADFLAANQTSPAAIQDVLLEELGHFIDAQINPVDTPGDEGAIFRTLVNQGKIAPAVLETLKAKDDAGIITIDAQAVAVEKAGYEGTNLADLKNGLIGVIDKLNAVLSTLGVGRSLPLVGSAIADAIDPAAAFLAQLRNTISSIDTTSGTVIKTALFNALGNSGLGWLLDSNSNGVDPDDIKLDETADKVTFNFSLGQAPKTLQTGIGFDIGIPGLGLQVSEGSKITAKVGYQFNLRFSIDKTAGFAFNTEQPDPELQVNLDVALPDFAATGKLGFLQVDVKDNPATPTNFKGAFGLNLKPGLTVDPTFSGEADINLQLKGKIPDGGGVNPDGTSKVPKLPSLGADFKLKWGFDKANARELGNPDSGGVPELAFNNVTLNLGSFASQFLSPITKAVDSAVRPAKPLIDFLTDDLPLVGLSLADLIRKQADAHAATGQGEPQSLAGLKAIEVLDQLLDLPSGAPDLPIKLGDFGLSGGKDIRTTLLTNPGLDDFDITALLTDVDKALRDIGAGETADYLKDKVAGLEGKDGPRFPLVENPKLALQLLLGKDVDLFNWDLSRTLRKQDDGEEFFGKVIGVSLKYDYLLQLSLITGFDTKGLRDFAGSNFQDPEKLVEGFYISDNIVDGVDKPEAIIRANFSAGPALGLKGFSISVSGLIGGEVTLEANDIDKDNKLRLSEITECVLDAKGKIVSSVEVQISIGFGFLKIRKRIPLVKGTLISFEAGCKPEEQTDRVRNQLAKEEAGQLVLLMGSRAGERVVGKNENGPQTDIAEYFVLKSIAGQPGKVEVQAFGGRITYNLGNRVVANGGNEGDSIIIDGAIATPADLQGNQGNDQIYGGAGNDTINGGSEDDDLKGGAGNDTLIGDSGDDVLEGGLGADSLDGGANFDQVSYGGSAVGVVLVASGTVLRGYLGDALGDTLNDVEYIIGSQQGDVISATTLTIPLVLEGLAGNDRLQGGSGNDILQGGLGRDTLNGGDGQDWTGYAESRASVSVNLTTGRGFGGKAQGDVYTALENVKGSAFYDDRLTGSSANNYLDGSGGNDTVEGRGGNDTLDGGDGIDWLTYRFASGGVNVNLKTGTTSADGYGSSDVLVDRDGEEAGTTNTVNNLPISSFENLEGSANNDSLAGDSQYNIIRGLAGADNIFGDDGFDTLVGGAGVGTLGDTLDGGLGLDWADYSKSPGAVQVNLTTGIGTGSDAQGDRLSNIENLLGSAYADNLVGNGINNVINPGLSYLGPTTRDVVDGAGVGDSDLLIVDYSRRDVGTGMTGGYDLGSTSAGSLSRSISSSNPSVLDGVTFSNIERLQVIGTIKSDTIYGGAGDDYIATGDGDDLIYGGFGNNVILADDGNDVVIDQSDANRQLQLFSNASFVYFDGGRGIDTLSVNLRNQSGNIQLISTNPLVENPNQRLTLPNGSAITRFEIFKDIATGNGNDTLTQLGRVDNTFETGSGNDTVNAGLGIDLLDGGFGFGYGYGYGSESDLLIVDYSVGDVGTNLLTEIEFLDGTIGGRYYRNESDGDLLDEVAFSSFERYQVTGTRQNDVIIGFGVDTLNGGDGTDLLVGGANNDLLFGGAGNDTLNGSERILGTSSGFGFPEVDTLTGGTGADEFHLGNGSDSYYLRRENSDYALITDFNAAEGDTLRLRAPVSSPLAVTAVSRYETTVADGNTQLFAVSSTGNRDLIAILQGVTNLDVNAPYVRYVSGPTPFNLTPPSTGTAGLSSLSALSATTLEVEPETLETSRAKTLSQAASLSTAAPATPLSVTQNNDTSGATTSLLTKLLGTTTGLSNFSMELTGDARAFGTFDNDPFGLGSGVVISTGKVVDLAGKNTIDGGFGAGKDVKLNFTKIGSIGETGVFRADLSNLGFDINSLTIQDSGSGTGGGSGYFSGFDLDGIKLSNTLLTSATDINTLPGLNVFDFSPLGTVFTPGNQRSGSDLFGEFPGSVNGLLSNGAATLGSFDYTQSNIFRGYVTLGDAVGNTGKIGFDLTAPVSTKDPLYLYIGEAGDNGEVAAGNISVSNRGLFGTSDLSTDFGVLGAENDDITATIEFDADATAQFFYFQFVFSSEEFIEYAGSEFNDAFSLKLNGLDLAQLSDGSQVTINNITPNSSGTNPDFIYNSAALGPAKDQTKVDGYTKVLTFAGPLEVGRNTLEINLQDVRDGLLDSAVFLKAGTFGVTPPPGFGSAGGGSGSGGGGGSLPGAPEVVFDLGSGLDVTEGGPADTFTVALATKPTGNVTVTLTPDSQLNIGAGASKPITLTFTSANALTPQTVSLTAIDDRIVEGLHAGRISATATSSDPTYNNLPLDPLLAVIQDGAVKPPKIINGTPYRDVLTGTSRDDIITGFAGADILRGRAGNDIFRYVSRRDAGDIITDFTVGQDKIQVTELLRSLSYSGSDPLGDGYFRFLRQGSNTILQLDPDGLGTARTPRNFLTVQNLLPGGLNNSSNFIF